MLWRAKQALCHCSATKSARLSGTFALFAVGTLCAAQKGGSAAYLLISCTNPEAMRPSEVPSSPEFWCSRLRNSPCVTIPTWSRSAHGESQTHLCINGRPEHILGTDLRRTDCGVILIAFQSRRQIMEEQRTPLCTLEQGPADRHNAAAPHEAGLLDSVTPTSTG